MTATPVGWTRRAVRAVQAHLAALADGETPPAMSPEPPNLERFTPRQYPALLRRVNRWREDARKRGVSVGTKTYRVFNDKWSGRKRDIFADHWTEMVECLEEYPDQTALELLVEIQVRYPGRYSQRQLHTLQKRVRVWRQQAVQRLIHEVTRTPDHASVKGCR